MCPLWARLAGLCRGSERGTARPEVLEALLGTTDRVVQEIDSVEYGLTDIQEYYANTGAVCCLQQKLMAGFAPSRCHTCLHVSNGVSTCTAFYFLSTHCVYQLCYVCTGADAMWRLQGH